MNVFALSTNFLHLDELLEESAGEMTPEIEALEKELITEAKDSLEQVGQYRLWIQNQVQVCKERRAALAVTTERLETKLNRVDEALVRVLQAIGKPQRFPEFTLSTTTRENASFSMKPGHEEFELAAGFVRTKFELNLSALKEAHKEGNLPEEVAAMVTSSTSVMQRKPMKKADETAATAA